METSMITATRPTARERHFREMAVWHDWPIPDQPNDQQTIHTNVASGERVASTLGGAALTAFGISRKSIPGWALAGVGAMLMYRGLSGHCPAYSGLRINTARRGMAEPVDFYEYGIQVTHSVTVNASPESLYRYWRDFTNLPRVMSHVESVEIVDDLVSHWVAKGPLNSRIEWDAEIINEEPYELIAWRSLPGAEIDNAGSVRFIRAPGARGTQVRVNMEYIPVAGRIGAALAKLFGNEPNQQVREDLRRFKHMMEAGEIATVQGQPVGSCAGRGFSEARSARDLRPMAHRHGYAGESEHDRSHDHTRTGSRMQDFVGREEPNEL
jgi:uncharacterized membrane protein